MACWSKKGNRSSGRTRSARVGGEAFALTVCPPRVLEGPEVGVLGGQGGGRGGGGRPLLPVEVGPGRWLGDQAEGGNQDHRVGLATLTSGWDCSIRRREGYGGHQT